MVLDDALFYNDEKLNYMKENYIIMSKYNTILNICKSNEVGIYNIKTQEKFHPNKRFN